VTIPRVFIVAGSGCAPFSPVKRSLIAIPRFRCLSGVSVTNPILIAALGVILPEELLRDWVSLTALLLIFLIPPGKNTFQFLLTDILKVAPGSPAAPFISFRASGLTAILPSGVRVSSIKEKGVLSWIAELTN
jgi:hypothetical protein